MALSANCFFCFINLLTPLLTYRETVADPQDPLRIRRSVETRLGSADPQDPLQIINQTIDCCRSLLQTRRLLQIIVADHQSNSRLLQTRLGSADPQDCCRSSINQTLIFK